MQLIPRWSARVLRLAIATVCVACGGGGDSAGTNPVGPTVRSVDVTPATLALTEGQQSTVSATPRDAGGAAITSKTVVWLSQDTTVATVSSTGLVTARRSGHTTVNATVDGISGTTAVSVVPAPVASVALTLPTSTIVVGQNVQSSVTTRDASGATLTGRAITYTTSDPTIATISATGVVTAVAPGTAVLSATSEGVVGALTVTVTPVPVASVTLTLANNSLIVGQTARATATAYDAAKNPLSGRVITYGTSNAAVATINTNGIVTGVGPGTATLTATVEGQSGTVTVTVVADPVATVTLALNSAFVGVGQSTATASVVTLRDANGTVLSGRTITYTTSDPSVATVSNTGMVQGVAAGTATITATSEGQSGRATVTVDVTPPSITGLTVVPDTIDVTSGAALVTVTMHVTDAGSGVKSVNVTLQTPSSSSHQIVQGCFMALSSGTSNDGMWQCTISFAQGLPSGNWTVSGGVTDQVANHRDYAASDLAGLGFVSTLTVRSNN